MIYYLFSRSEFFSCRSKSCLRTLDFWFLRTQAIHYSFEWIVFPVTGRAGAMGIAGVGEGIGKVTVVTLPFSWMSGRMN